MKEKKWDHSFFIKLGLLSIVEGINTGVFTDQIKEDEVLNGIFQSLLDNKPAPNGYELHGDLLTYRGRLVLPPNLPTVSLLLEEFHNSPVGGHQGTLKTYQHLSQEVYWTSMKGQVRAFVAECSICQQAKYLTLSPANLIQPLPVPEQIWEDISMDLIEGLPKSDGFDTILVIVDRLSKYAHFLPLKHPFNVVSFATIFVRKVVRLHGCPRSIVFDRDNIFTSLF